MDKKMVSGSMKGAKGRRLWKKVKYQLVEYHSLPAFLKDNEYILGHYRSEWPMKQVLLSIFSIHNETLNVWTHLVGFLLFLALTVYTATKVPRVIQMAEMLGGTEVTGVGFRLVQKMVEVRAGVTRWPLFAFLGGAMFCLLSSSACHLLSCHSAGLSYVMLRLDYAGIAALISASHFPPVYYSFVCRPSLRTLYLSAVSSLGAAAVLFSLLPSFQTPRRRTLRASLFFGMGASGVVPILHKLLLFGPRHPHALLTTSLELLMGSFYALGALLYSARVPERWRPGRFDLAGHSHQLFHLLVLAGAFTHYRAGLLYLDWRDSEGCS